MSFFVQKRVNGNIPWARPNSRLQHSGFFTILNFDLYLKQDKKSSLTLEHLIIIRSSVQETWRFKYPHGFTKRPLC
jgi:hypothetical protein